MRPSDGCYNCCADWERSHHQIDLTARWSRPTPEKNAGVSASKPIYEMAASADAVLSSDSTKRRESIAHSSSSDLMKPERCRTS
jgi:hypothetical protein